MTWETAYECIYAARPTGARLLIRTSIGNPGEVEKALDVGAGGVVVPMVNSLAEAQAVARAAKYPPTGVRSLGGDHYLHYGDDYFEKANAETLLLVQMEHIDAVEQAEEIMALPGVDGCFVGPVDLALSMGLSRHRSSYEQQPAYQAAMERIVTTTLAAGKKPCCKHVFSRGFRGQKSRGFPGPHLQVGSRPADGPGDATTGLSQGKYRGLRPRQTEIAMTLTCADVDFDLKTRRIQDQWLRRL